MPEANGLQVVERVAVQDAEQAAVRALDAACRAAGLGESRITWDSLAVAEEVPNNFLVYVAGQLVGFLRADGLGTDEAEATVLVSPDINTQPVVAGLVAAALAACRAHHTPALIIAVDRRAVPVAEAVGMHGATLHFTEEKRRRASTGPVALPTSELAISDAEAHDAAAIAAILADDLGMDPVGFRQHIAANMVRPIYHYYIARHNGAPAATANVQQLNGDAYIYGLVVRPEFRGRGYGRLLMLRMLADLAATGDAPMYIEVEPQNTPAVTLYRSLGFETVATFDYYRLDVL